MKNRKINPKAAIACAAIVLTIIACVFSFLTDTARALAQPMETVRINQLSDIEDGYDASLCSIAYEIEAPAF